MTVIIDTNFFRLEPSRLGNLFKHKASLQASTIVMYSTSTVHKETYLCNFELPWDCSLPTKKLSYIQSYIFWINIVDHIKKPTNLSLSLLQHKHKVEMPLR